MLLLPSAVESLEDQRAVGSLVLSLLRRAGLETDAIDITAIYPGLWALAFAIQKDASGADDPGAAVEGARSAAERALSPVCPAMAIDAAPPERHLRESLERAVAQAPVRPGREAHLAEMAMGDWGEEERAVLCEAGCLLHELWPEAAAELVAVVRQVGLLDGRGIDGFTDFRTHGAVFVNRRRFASGDPVPAPVRVAEALIHEGAHTRCNAAAAFRPFLAGAPGQAPGADEPLIMTPLRPDPRPLNGAFQQLVVLVRCGELYGRLAGAGVGGEAVAGRGEDLRGLWRQALGILAPHGAKLSDCGRAVMDEAGALLANTVSS